MRRMVKDVRNMLATLPDDAPVFAEIWTPEDVRVWLRQWLDAYAMEDERPPGLDLDDPSVIARAMDCIPLGDWSIHGDDLMDLFHERLREAFDGASSAAADSE